MSVVFGIRASGLVLQRRKLMRTASIAAVTASLLAAPAQAQLVRLRGGVAAPVVGNGVNAASGVDAGRTLTMRAALQAQKTTQQQAADIRSYVTAARQAAAATSPRAVPTDGISVNGLYPIATIREAMRLARTGSTADATQSANLLIAARAANDVSGTATWDGAGLPTVDATNTKVEIAQTQSRAILSWDRFDIGANTTLNFRQRLNGAVQSDWIAVNRVVNSVDPTTILGKLTADSQVYILNNAGVIFGRGSQVNLRSLIVSSLELGNYGSSATPGAPENPFKISMIQDRNSAFLNNGPFPTQSNAGLAGPETAAPPLFLSPNVVADPLTLDAKGQVRTGNGARVQYLPAIEGDVIVDPGATITAATGGSIILAGPKVENSGILQATEGQVSLVGGRLITFSQLTGEAGSNDPSARGLYLRAVTVNRSINPGTNSDIILPRLADALRDPGSVANRGLIESKRGYLSVVTTEFGTIVNEGLLAATTSVSRNGKIGLYGGNITISGAASSGQAGAITILPDETGETIPQGSDAEPASFKRSVIEFGMLRPSDYNVPTETTVAAYGQVQPTNLNFGTNALLYAPNAIVTNKVGGTTSDAVSPSSITIGENARIDVAGLKDVVADVARNFVTIDPVKRNELRDTPNYRDVAVGRDFTLNGTTLTVDVRRSGVRADGVRWIGSPLLEAGSIASQIPITVSELMTSGGDIDFAPNATFQDAGRPAFALGKGATIDISGGWLRYDSGQVATSKLVTADGRIVDIGDADPNDDFVSVYDGFNDTQPRFGISNLFRNPITTAARTEAGYDEGRDAGSLSVTGSAKKIDGIIIGAAYAGVRQAANGLRPTSTQTTAGNDLRKLQANSSEMPSGGFVNLTAPGQNLVFYKGALGSQITGPGNLLLDADMLSAAQLSALTLTGAFATFADAKIDNLNLSLTPAQTAAGVNASDLLTLTGSSNLALAAGGIFNLETTRAIRVLGSIAAPAGTINLATTGTKVDAQGNTGFAEVFASVAALPKVLDITVAGTISTAGLWVNEFLGGDASIGKGKAWINGGSISLATASNIFAAIGPSLALAQSAGDLSGSIDILSGSLLDVSAGGYVRADQSFDLTGSGGSVSLLNNTVYASLRPSERNSGTITDQLGASPLYGDNQSVGFTPLAADALFSQRLVPSLVVDPSAPRSHVSIADGTLSGIGFGGGGVFSLVAPDITFGSEALRTDATHIGLDFLSETGFGALNLTSNRSLIVPKLFDNGTAYNSAFRQVTSFIVRSGETLDLTQTLFPQLTARDDLDALLSFTTGGSIRTLAALSPTAPSAQAAFDRRAVDLRLGGLSELVVERGGTLSGAAGAVVEVSKVVNSGTIALPGGTISQREFLTDPIMGTAVGLNFGAAPGRNAFGFGTLTDVLGGPLVGSSFSESAPNSAGIINPVTGGLATNAQLFTIAANSILGLGRSERFLVALGVGDGNVGIELRAGSVTDLSGTALFDPRARFIRDAVSGATRQSRIGKIIGGGAIITASPVANDVGGDVPAARLFNALPGSIIDLSGTRATFDLFVPTFGYLERDEWSAGGRIAALAGGSVAGAQINAYGGYADDAGSFVRSGLVNATLATPEALGGTLEWQQPTFRATDPAVISANTLYADKISASGFDTLISRGAFVLDGAFDLNVDKAFVATGRISANGAIRVGDFVNVSATAGSNASINAPYIRFDGRAATANAGPIDTLLPATVNFKAGALGIDFVGSTAFDGTIGTLSFITAGDIRFIGIDPRLPSEIANGTRAATLDGQVRMRADTVFDAGRVYATTGTGNLQAIAEYEAAGTAPPRTSGAIVYNPYLVKADGFHRLTFGGSAIDRATPLSAGSFLAIEAQDIIQNGHLAAPIGRLSIGTATALLDDSTPRQTLTPATRSVTFGAGSLTTVAGGATPIPYGTTLDLKEYFFAPYSNSPLTVTPISQLTLTGEKISVDGGATVDLKGGGDIFAYEFVSGIGGSRDVLDRINTDAFSSNSYIAASGQGFQFPDRRQVYAIIPTNDIAKIASFDPVYSDDYGEAGPADLYGGSAGLSVRLDASGDIPAGDYLLLPAHYALLDGKNGIKAYRVVENVGRAAPAPGLPEPLRDGSVIVSGRYAFAGTGITESTLRAFALQSGDTFRRSSQLATTSGSETIKAIAERADKPVPRLPIDAARLILSPLTELRIAGFFDTTTVGGKGAQVDIGGDRIVIAPELTGGLPTLPTAGDLTLFDGALRRLNADSLFIGGRREANSDGTTDLRIDANRISVLSGSELSAPELLLAVGNQQADGTLGTSSLIIAAGATLRAEGTLADPTSTDLIIRSSNTGATGLIERPAGFAAGDDASGAGSVVRLANGPERLIKRIGEAAADNTRANATLTIGDALLTGNGAFADNLAIETSFNFGVADAARLEARNIALSGDAIIFNVTGLNGLIRPALLATLGSAERLTLRSPNAIQFADAATSYPVSGGVFAFKNLVIDAPAITAIQAGLPTRATNVAITTQDFRWFNSSSAVNSCIAFLCGRANTALSITASGEVAFGNGFLRTLSVGGTVDIAAARGIFYEGDATLDVANAALTLTTPFIADRAVAADPREQIARADLTLASNAGIVVAAPAGSLPTAYADVGGNRAPGARLVFGTADARTTVPGQNFDITINNALLLASAGTIDLRAKRNLTLTGAATIAAPGFTKRFGDAIDFVTVAAPGGTLNLGAGSGDITFNEVLSATGAILRPTLVSDGGPAAIGAGDPLKGASGSIRLIASAGAIRSFKFDGTTSGTFGAGLNPGVSGPRLGNFTFDSSRSPFDLATFLSQSGALFGGALVVRSGAGDLVIGASQILKSETVSLTADGGAVTVAGTIDTAGIDVRAPKADGSTFSLSEASKARVAGGTIELYGQNGVALESSAVLDTRSRGYADLDPRSARAGDVTIGIGDAAGAAIVISPGARIDVSATRVSQNLADGLSKSTGRFVAETAKEPGTLVDRTVYRFVEADSGGTITLRAPVVGTKVDVRLPTASAFIGADEVQIAGVRRYDLNALAGVPGISGTPDNGIILDPSVGYALPTPFAGNLLSSDFITTSGIPSIPNFIRTFDISAADGATSLVGYRLRPAVDLVSTGAISLHSNWNLAAATVDEAAAFAAGLFDIIEPLSTSGKPVYALKTGREADLLAGFGAYTGADFLYRVGGKATGEAPILNLRARGDAIIARSISDGFFVFRDRSDVAFTNYQLGGGDRVFNPAVVATCSIVAEFSTCGNVVPYDPTIPGGFDRNYLSVRVSIASAIGGSQSSPLTINSPYSAAANNAAGMGTALDIVTGRPIGASQDFAELLPVIGSGSMRSSDVTVVAGADATPSANPSHVDFSQSACVRVVDGILGATGQPARPEYRLAPVRGKAIVAGNDLQLEFNTAPLSIENYSIGDILSVVEPGEYSVDLLDRDSYATLNWGAPSQDGYRFAFDMCALASATCATGFFDGRPILGTRAITVGVVAPFGQILDFLEANKSEYLARIADGRVRTTLPPMPPLITYAGGGIVPVQTAIRTGTGSLTLSASANVDLRDGENVQYRLESGAKGLSTGPTLQMGGSSVYTAGERVGAGTVTGRFVDGTSATVVVTSPSLLPAAEDVTQAPTPYAQSGRPVVLARGGGDIVVRAGADVLGRSDDWSQANRARSGDALKPQTPIFSATFPVRGIGSSGQIWRAGVTGTSTEWGIAPQYFTSGVGALAGGNVSIAAGRNVDQLTVALDTSITTELALPLLPNTLLTFGGGNLAVIAGGDLAAGEFDVTAGQARFDIGSAIRDVDAVRLGASKTVPARSTAFRIENATFDVAAGGDATNIFGGSVVSVQSINAEGRFSFLTTGGALYSPITALNVKTLGNLTYRAQIGAPSSLELTSIVGAVALNKEQGPISTTLFPSPIGQLSILSALGLTNFSIAMLDSDPSLLGTRVFSGGNLGTLDFPGIDATISEAQRRQLHNNVITHENDMLPAVIFTDGSIDTSSIIFAKQGTIVAGKDIVNSYIVGQNINANDQTRVAAGRDITATTQSRTDLGSRLPFFGPNTIIVGGPGSVSVEAGRDLGPFATSAIIGAENRVAAGGIYTVGNEFNPWLGAEGASLSVLFGVGPGMDYANLRETYLNPANFATLDGDLFVQQADTQNNLRPDRTKQVYAPVLAAWLRDNQNAAFANVFGTTSFATDVALADAAFGKAQALYEAFSALPLKQQQPFLIQKLYFNELEQASLPSSPSFQQYVRGYRAIEALFPTSLGYTDNLAAYELDPATVSADNPLGVPRRKLVDGQPLVADQILTGNADLRFSAIQTARGGDITIMGPGGEFLAGSVVRSREQPLRRSTSANSLVFGVPAILQATGRANIVSTGIKSIPPGYEGILTLRSGAIRYFSDGDLRLNQSRLFTNATGNISAWSSNGDLNAGQGPKSAANFPPVTVRFGLNGLPVVDTAGAIVGAGIGAFKQLPTDPNSQIVLIAPVGEVDAGDAGVRASGDIFVAAARVANADNFAAGGTLSGVPSTAIAAAPAVPASAGSALAAIIKQSQPKGLVEDLRSMISVDILGYSGGDRCLDPENDDPNCPK